jgi:hypothetical protein
MVLHIFILYCPPGLSVKEVSTGGPNDSLPLL